MTYLEKMNSPMSKETEIKRISTSLKAEMEVFEQSVIRIMRDNSFSVMESILFHCEKNEIEVELVAKLITPNLKTKLKKEAVSLHFIKARRRRKKLQGDGEEEAAEETS